MFKLGHKGFTLVEILILIAIIALLAAIAMPTLLKTRNDASALNNLKAIAEALERYAVDNNGRYPVTANLTKLATHKFATEAPVYIDAGKLITPQFGHTLQFAGGAKGYQLAANASNAQVTGNKDYRISTGAVLEKQGASEDDYVVTAP